MKKSETKRQFTLNNKLDNQDITNEFADNFNTLLNTPLIERKSKAQVLHTETLTELIITTEEIKAAISLLKENKSADPFSMVGGHIIYAEN